MTGRERLLQSGIEPAALLDVIGGCSLRLLPTPSRPPAPSPSCPTAGPPQPGSRWAWSAEASKQVRRKPIRGVQIRISEQPDLCPESSTVSPLFTASCGGESWVLPVHPSPSKKLNKKKLDVLGGWSQHLSGGLGSPRRGIGALYDIIEGRYPERCVSTL